MAVLYPKHPKDIFVLVICQEQDISIESALKTRTEVSLTEKIRDYYLSQECSSVDIHDMVMPLMTYGKVSVHLSDHVERLQLSDPKNKLSRIQTVNLIEDLIRDIVPTEDLQNMKKITRHILMPIKKSGQ